MSDGKRIETVRLPVKELKTGFGNPRKISKKKKEELMKSLETFGDFGLFVIDEDNNLIAGNQRASLLMEKDPETEVLCKRLVGYSEAEKRAINIKGNTHSGEWDLDMLAEWTADITVDLGLEEITKKDAKQRSIKEMEPIAYEEYDYVMIVCKSGLDYDNLINRLGLRDAVVRVRQKKTIQARAVWFHEIANLLFGGKE